MAMDQDGNRREADDGLDESSDGGWYFDLPSGAWERQEAKNRELRQSVRRNIKASEEQGITGEDERADPFRARKGLFAGRDPEGEQAGAAGAEGQWRLNRHATFNDLQTPVGDFGTEAEPPQAPQVPLHRPAPAYEERPDDSDAGANAFDWSTEPVAPRRRRVLRLSPEEIEAAERARQQAVRAAEEAARRAAAEAPASHLPEAGDSGFLQGLRGWAENGAAPPPDAPDARVHPYGPAPSWEEAFSAPADDGGMLESMREWAAKAPEEDQPHTPATLEELPPELLQPFDWEQADGDAAAVKTRVEAVSEPAPVAEPAQEDGPAPAMATVMDEEAQHVDAYGQASASPVGSPVDEESAWDVAPEAPAQAEEVTWDSAAAESLTPSWSLVDEEPAPAMTTEAPAPPKRQGLFGRLFGRKKQQEEAHQDGLPGWSTEANILTEAVAAPPSQGTDEAAAGDWEPVADEHPAPAFEWQQHEQVDEAEAEPAPAFDWQQERPDEAEPQPAPAFDWQQERPDEAEQQPAAAFEWQQHEQADEAEAEPAPAFDWQQHEQPEAESQPALTFDWQQEQPDEAEAQPAPAFDWQQPADEVEAEPAPAFDWQLPDEVESRPAPAFAWQQPDEAESQPAPAFDWQQHEQPDEVEAQPAPAFEWQHEQPEADEAEPQPAPTFEWQQHEQPHEPEEQPTPAFEWQQHEQADEAEAQPAPAFEWQQQHEHVVEAESQPAPAFDWQPPREAEQQPAPAFEWQQGPAEATSEWEDPDAPEEPGHWMPAASQPTLLAAASAVPGAPEDDPWSAIDRAEAQDTAPPGPSLPPDVMAPVDTESDESTDDPWAAFIAARSESDGPVPFASPVAGNLAGTSHWTMTGSPADEPPGNDAAGQEASSEDDPWGHIAAASGYDDAAPGEVGVYRGRQYRAPERGFFDEPLEDDEPYQPVSIVPPAPAQPAAEQPPAAASADSPSRPAESAWDFANDEDIVLRAFEAHASSDVDGPQGGAGIEPPDDATAFHELLGRDAAQLVDGEPGEPIIDTAQFLRPQGRAPQPSASGEGSLTWSPPSVPGLPAPGRGQPGEIGWSEDEDGNLPPWDDSGFGDGTPAGEPVAAGHSRGKTLVREVVETGLLAILVFLAVRASFQNFKVDGTSMYPTLQNGQFLIVNKLVYSEVDMHKLSRFLPFIDAPAGDKRDVFHGPERGDIVVLKDPKRPDTDLIKRVIGLPGENIEIVSGKVYINGRYLEEPYIKTPWHFDRAQQTIPDGYYFVMGDNRDNSLDSRSPQVGLVPRDLVIGKAMLSYWPLSTFGLAPNASPKLDEKPTLTTKRIGDPVP